MAASASTRPDSGERSALAGPVPDRHQPRRPEAPQQIATSGLDETTLNGLILRSAYTVSRFTTEWMYKNLFLSQGVIREVLEKLTFEGSIEQLWQTSQASSHYKVTDTGPGPRRAADGGVRLRRPGPGQPGGVLGHPALAVRQRPAGPAGARRGGPVRARAPEKASELAGLAVSSGRSLFVFGPPGNGKSSLGRQLHAALQGDFCIPYAISVGDNVIRLFDAQIHQRVEVATERPEAIDQRWIRIRRPMVVVGVPDPAPLMLGIVNETLRTSKKCPSLRRQSIVHRSK